MPSEPLIALALSLLISLAPFLPAAEKSAPEEEPAPAVEEQPALSAEQLAALAQTPASWFDEPTLLDALSKLPHYDETRAQRYLAYRTGGVWTLETTICRALPPRWMQTRTTAISFWSTNIAVSRATMCRRTL